MKKQLLLIILINMNISAQNIVNEKLIPFHDKQGKWGYLDADSDKIMIPAKYDFANLFENWIGSVGYINPNSKTRYDEYLSGYIRENGEEVLPINFLENSEAKDSSNNIIDNLRHIVFDNGTSGVLKLPEGKWLVEPGKYEDSFRFYKPGGVLVDDIVFCDGNKKYSAPTGCKINRIDFINRIFYITKGKVGRDEGISTWEGKIIVKPKYIKVNYFEKTKTFLASTVLGWLTMANIEKKIVTNYLFDENGKQIVTFKSKQIPFVRKDESIGRYTYEYKEFNIDLKTGMPILEPKSEFEPKSKFESKEIVFQNSITGLYGLINQNGKEIIPFKYKYSFYFVNGLAIVHTDSGEGVIDNNGNEVIQPMYKKIFRQEIKDKILLADKNFSYQKSTYFTAEKDEKWGLFDSTGALIIPFEYGFISKPYNDQHFLKGWIQTSDLQRDKSGKINIYFNVIIPPNYNGINIYDDFLTVSKRVGSDYTYQLLNLDGKPISEIIYDQMDFTNGYFIVKKDKQEGIMNIDGKILVPLKFKHIWKTALPNLIFIWDKERYFYVNVRTGKEYKLN